MPAPVSSPMSEKSLGNVLEDAVDVLEKADDLPTIKSDPHFKAVFLALCLSTFLGALDLTALGRAAIAKEFHASNAQWIGTSYALSSTALIPFIGGLATMLGRRPVTVAALIVFMVGSTVCGSAQSFGALVAGRTVQGTAAGALLVLAQIIISDIVPEAESRGSYYGFLGTVWGLSLAVGPMIAGAMGTSLWRWLFYLNVPVGGFALGNILLFLNVKAPERSFKEQLSMLNHNNHLFTASSVSATLGLSWAGTTHAWNSAAVLAPLILGLAGIVAYVVIERHMKFPTLPWSILGHPTSAIGYLTSVSHSILCLNLFFYWPTFFQSVHGASPLKSGVDCISVLCTVAPCSTLMGVFVARYGHWKWLSVGAWALASIGLGLMSLVTASTPLPVACGYAALVGIAFGILYSATFFPTIAPLEPNQHAQAAVAHTFSRSFGQIMGIAVGGSILQSQLGKNLPAEVAALAGGPGVLGNLAFEITPIIKTLPEPLRGEAQRAFAESLRVIWLFGAILSAATFVIATHMQSIPLTTSASVPSAPTAQRNERDKDIEKGAEPQGKEKSQEVEPAADTTG